MSANNKSLTLYDSWDMKDILIPSRSRLFSLEPIGIGTSYVESLSSYVTRLAEVHCVYLGILMTREIKSALSKEYRSRDLFCMKDRTGTVNGTGRIAKDLEYRKSKSLQKIQQYISQVQKAVIELNKKGIYPSESNVSKFVGTPGYFRYKEVRSALKKARDDLGIR